MSEIGAKNKGKSLKGRGKKIVHSNVSESHILSSYYTILLGLLAKGHPGGFGPTSSSAAAGYTHRQGDMKGRVGLALLASRED